MKTILRFIVASSLLFFAALSPAVEVFPWDEMSTTWTWNANTGLLKGKGASILQTNPSPKKMTVKLEFPHGGTSMICSGQGERMELGAVPIGEQSWEWKSIGKNNLDSDDVNVLLDKKQTDLPRWKGTLKNKEGVTVSYQIIYINDSLLFGLMTGKQGGISFTRSFTLTR
ncbi:hypothetical protein [Luteolibacter sp. AS25]|uniref:hypothetical protein n=1 Tax=Luteolibacter sp. AS25 TaxID=3135776 RepID=UPI00398AA069